MTTKKTKAVELAALMNKLTPSVNIDRMTKRLANNMTEHEIDRAISYMKLTHNI